MKLKTIHMGVRVLETLSRIQAGFMTISMLGLLGILTVMSFRHQKCELLTGLAGKGLAYIGALPR